MRRNPQIVVPDHLPVALQFRSHRSISFLSGLSTVFSPHFPGEEQTPGNKCPRWPS
jgi:hypothetical protein